jgi:hypothetical protein
MGGILKHLRNARFGLLALLALALAPAVLEAAGWGFRNDTSQPIYVQGSIVVNGQVKRGPLILIKPGQTAWDVNLPSGPRTITVYNSANQKLYQETRTFQGADVLFVVTSAAAVKGQPQVNKSWRRVSNLRFHSESWKLAATALLLQSHLQLHTFALAEQVNRERFPLLVC